MQANLLGPPVFLFLLLSLRWTTVLWRRRYEATQNPSAERSVCGDDVPRLFRTPPDPKRRTPPYSPLRGLTFVKQAPFLTGSSTALHLRLSTNAPQTDRPAPAKGNLRTYRRIGASESLERDRGPGRPPSERSERVYVVN